MTIVYELAGDGKTRYLKVDRIIRPLTDMPLLATAWRNLTGCEDFSEVDIRQYTAPTPHIDLYLELTGS